MPRGGWRGHVSVGIHQLIELEACLPSMTEECRVWLVDRAFSDDEQNLIIATYATADGAHSYRKELAVQSLSGEFSLPNRELVDADNLSPVEDEETREWYRRTVESRIEE